MELCISCAARCVKAPCSTPVPRCTVHTRTKANHYLRVEHKPAPHDSCYNYVHTSTATYALHRCQHCLAQPCTPALKPRVHTANKQLKLKPHQHIGQELYRTQRNWAIAALNRLLVHLQQHCCFHHSNSQQSYADTHASATRSRTALISISCAPLLLPNRLPFPVPALS